MWGVLRLSPWTRAPRLLWRFPVVWWALAATGALLGLAVAVTPLYLGSIATASVAHQAAGRCAWTAGLSARGAGALPAGGAAGAGPEVAAGLLGDEGRTVLDLDARAAHLGPPVATLVGGAAAQAPPGRRDVDVQVIYRTGGEQRIHVTARVPGEGVLLTEEVAAALDSPPGTTVHLAGDAATAPYAVRVVGTYRDLADLPVAPYWCSIDRLVHLQDIFGVMVPPPIALATEPGVVTGLASQVDPARQLGAYLERPLRQGVTIDQADQAMTGVRRAVRGVPRSDGRGRHAALTTELPFIVHRAHAVQAATTPPIAALATGAVLAALGLAGVAGSFWAERRRSELDLLSARGVGPGALAGKAALECAPPLLLGVLVGSLLAALAVVAVGPAAEVSTGAATLAAAAVPAGGLLALAVLAASVRRRLRSEGAATAQVRHRSLRDGQVAVLEVALLVGTLVELRHVGRLRAIPDVTTLPSFGLSRLLLPLLALLLTARLALRLLVRGLRRVRGRGDGLPLPLLLAAQRLASVPRVPAALAVVVAVASGTCVYSAGLADSLQRTVTAKADLFVGARTSIELLGPQQVPALPGAAHRTEVFVMADTTRRGAGAVDVLGVDPTTFAQGAAWQPGYASSPLAALMARLRAPAAAGVVPAVAVGDVPDHLVVGFGREAPAVDVPLAVVARAEAFPDEGSVPLLVVSTATLSSTAPAAVRFSTERVWVDGPPQPLLNQLRAAGVEIRSTTTSQQVSAAPVLEAVLQTLSALRVLGLLAGVLALVGLLVYVDVRARRRRLAAVLTRRMGLRTRTEWASGWIEVGAVAGTGVVLGVLSGGALVRVVARLLDPLPLSPPRPSVVQPTGLAWSLVAGAVVAAALIAAAGLRRPPVDAAVLRAE